jgi:hypothetical protein
MPADPLTPPLAAPSAGGVPSLLATVATLALLVGPAGLMGCGGGESDSPPDASTPGGPADEEASPAITDADPQAADEEDLERRARNAAVAERQRQTLIDELIDLPATRSIAAADVMMLVPRENPPRLFELDESEIEALPAGERTEAIARYDRIARGLKELAARALDESESLSQSGARDAASDLLRRVRDLARASAGDSVAELGRDAARAVLTTLNAALGEDESGGAGATGG